MDIYEDDEWDFEESDFAGYIDDGELFDAQVISVKKQKKNFTDRETGEAVWKSVFKFRLISTDGHDGQEIYGETGVKLSSNPDCKLTNWVEAALGMQIPKGYKLRASVLADRRCRVEVGKRDYEKDGVLKSHNFVKSVIPTREAMDAMASRSTFDDSPF